MKNLEIPFRACTLLFSTLILMSFSPLHARSNSYFEWKPLLTGHYGISIAFTAVNDSNAYLLSFRHNLGGYARMMLVLRHTTSDGATQDLAYECNGFPLNVLTADGINATIPADGSIEIVRLHLVFTRYGEQYILDIDAEGNVRSLTKSGRMYNYEQGLALIDKVLQVPLPQQMLARAHKTTQPAVANN